MSRNITQRRAPGSVEPFVSLNPAPITDAKQPPSTTDYFEPSTIWIQPTDTTGAPVNQIWILASTQNAVANWIQVAVQGGAGVFSSIDVTTGPNFIDGNTSINGNVSINALGTGTTTIGGGANNGNIVIGNPTSATQTITLASSVNGGIALNAAGILSADLQASTTASPTVAVTMNTRLGYANFTGFTTAAAGNVSFTITNAFATLGSAILASANNLGANDAKMHITRITPGAGSLTINLTNTGAAALNGDINITFWVLD